MSIYYIYIHIYLYVFFTHHWLNGHEFEQTQGDGVGQRSLLCCSSWGHKELDMIYRLNNNSRESTQDGARGKGTEVTACKQDWELLCRTSVQRGRSHERAQRLPSPCLITAWHCLLNYLGAPISPLDRGQGAGAPVWGQGLKGSASSQTWTRELGDLPLYGGSNVPALATWAFPDSYEIESFWQQGLNLLNQFNV